MELEGANESLLSTILFVLPLSDTQYYNTQRTKSKKKQNLASRNISNVEEHCLHVTTQNVTTFNETCKTNFTAVRSSKSFFSLCKPNWMGHMDTTSP